MGDRVHDEAAGGAWWALGLRFECTGCGRCCTGGDSRVWVTVDEIRALAASLGLGLDDFGRRYLRRIGERYALLDGPGGACVFLEDRRCSVYDRRPAQCRTFPFWPAHVASPEAWKGAAASCEGISDRAPVVDAAAIRRALAVAKEAGLTPDGAPGRTNARDGDTRGR